VLKTENLDTLQPAQNRYFSEEVCIVLQKVFESLPLVVSQPWQTRDERSSQMVF
jgi:hypothetical protein